MSKSKCSVKGSQDSEGRTREAFELRQNMSDNFVRLPVAHYQLSRNYGPGMSSAGGVIEGLRQKTLEKNAGRFGLVLVHCWNLGEKTGPYPLAENQGTTGTNSDWVIAAGEIIAEKIAPVLAAARETGIPVFHLASGAYAAKYPQYRRILDDDELKGPEVGYESRQCIRPVTVDEEWAERFGPNWPGPVWETHPETFDIAHAVRPTENEHVVVDGWQLSGLCRRLDVDTLVYAGFMANVCLLHVPGAMIEMAKKFRYRCVVLHDCTVAHELIPTLPNHDLTKAAIRYIEFGLGYSTSSHEFIQACQDARDCDVRATS